MTKETKAVPFSEFKLASEGSGSFEGYASVFSELDDVGDIVLPGAYADTLDDFLQTGFTAQSHDWSLSGLVGYPVKADEDEHGLFVRSLFHSDDDSQRVRKKVLERSQAGKRVSLSIGYEPLPTPIIVLPKDYQSELPKYVRTDLVEETLQKAERFSQVRVLPKIKLYEYSIVAAPALQSAMTTSVKSADIESVLLGLGTDLEYAAHLERLGTAIKTFTTHTEARMEMRTKEGRVLSSANWSELQELYDRLGKLLDAAKPRPKEEQETTDEGEKSAEKPQLRAAYLLEYYARQARVRAVLHRSN